MRIAQNRRPYKVEYYKDGKREVLYRTPPPRLHDHESGDRVTLTRKKNGDWDEGDSVKVRSISDRQPNVLAVEREGGQYTFVSALDVRGQPRASGFDVIASDDVAHASDPIGAKYLLWP